MDDFARTRRGTKFFDADIPKLVQMLERVSIALEESNKLEEKKLLLEHKKWLKENRQSADQADEKLEDAQEHINNLKDIKLGNNLSE